MTTIASLIPAYLPPKPTEAQIAEAAPIRLQSRAAVMKRYDLFTKESQSYTDAGMTVYQIKPIKTFLETEVAWWNANVELTNLQVNTRITSYKEKLETLNKEFQINLDTAISLLPPEKAQVIVDKIAEIEAESKEGFADISGSSTPATPATLLTDLSGASASVDISSLQEIIDKKNEAIATEEDKKNLAAISRTVSDDISSAAKYVFRFVGTIVYICIAIRFAAFAANDLFYKPLAYRTLAFLYAFIFVVPLFPYYLYREIMHLIWPSIDAPYFRGIFPIFPYDPQSPLNIYNRFFGYADIPSTAEWVAFMVRNESATRLNTLQSSVLPRLMAERAAAEA